MGRLFDSPLTIVIILVVILLLFGAPKLPGMARSLGQSMRIFKSEVKEMKKDDASNVTVDGQTVPQGQNVGSHQYQAQAQQGQPAPGQPAQQYQQQAPVTPQPAQPPVDSVPQQPYNVVQPGQGTDPQRNPGV